MNKPSHTEKPPYFARRKAVAGLAVFSLAVTGLVVPTPQEAQASIWDRLLGRIFEPPAPTGPTVGTSQEGWNTTNVYYDTRGTQLWANARDDANTHSAKVIALNSGGSFTFPTTMEFDVYYRPGQTAQTYVGRATGVSEDGQTLKVTLPRTQTIEKGQVLQFRSVTPLPKSAVDAIDGRATGSFTVEKTGGFYGSVPAAAKLKLEGPDGELAVRNDGGSVRREELMPGTYYLTVTQPGFRQKRVRIDVTANNMTDFRTVSLEQITGAVAGSVTGLVGTDTVTVRVMDRAGNERYSKTVSEQDPSFGVNLPEGTYRVELDTLNGYEVAQDSALVTIDSDGRADRNATFAVQKYGTVKGEIKGLAEGEHVTVTVTDPRGNEVYGKRLGNEGFEVRNRTSGAYTVTVSDVPGNHEVVTGELVQQVRIDNAGNADRQSSVTFKHNPPQPAPKPQPKPAPKPVTTGTITGSVVDEDGAPQQATVIIRDAKGKQAGTPITTDADGTFVTSALEEGDYVVVVKAPAGFNNPVPVEIAVRAGKANGAGGIVVKQAKLDIERPDQAENTVSGWLVDDANRPIFGVNIEVTAKATDKETGERYEVTVPVAIDERGYFVTNPIDFGDLGDSPGFKWKVVLPDGWEGKLADDSAPLEGTFTLAPGGTHRIDPIRVIAPTTTVGGTIGDGKGKAIPGIVVTVTDSRGNTQIADVQSNGTFEVDEVPPGVAEVRVLTPGNTRDVEPMEIPVRPGQPVLIPDIYLTPKAIKLTKMVWDRDANTSEITDADQGAMTMVAGDPKGLQYRFIIENTSDQPLTNVTISDKLFDDPSTNPSASTITLTKGDLAKPLAPGETLEFAGRLDTPADAYDFNNLATAWGTAPDGSRIASNPDPAYTRFVQAEAEKKVNARFATNPDKPVSMPAGRTVSFTYEVVNTGSTPMVGVTVEDTVYEGAPGAPRGKGVPLKVHPPEGFNGTLLPGQRVIFTGEPVTLRGGTIHHNAATARGELPPRPKRGRAIESEPNFGEDPASVLIITPRENIKGNAHIIVDSGVEAATDVQVVAYVDTNGNGRQDEGEGIEGLNLSLQRTDNSPVVPARTDENGNVLFEGAPAGEYYIKMDNPGGLKLARPRAGSENSSEPGTVLEGEVFEITGEEEFGLKSVAFELLSDVDAGATVEPAGSSACMAGMSASNPLLWLIPIAALSATVGGAGVVFQDQINQAANDMGVDLGELRASDAVAGAGGVAAALALIGIGIYFGLCGEDAGSSAKGESAEEPGEV